tara:strand:+ start:489 stop:641 length:153 start_codon:yes stop_codon:yes gene_type:complete
MKTIATKTINKETYTIAFNGSSTYMVIDNTNTAIFRADTLRKANNFLNKI